MRAGVVLNFRALPTKQNEHTNKGKNMSNKNTKSKSPDPFKTRHPAWLEKTMAEAKKNAYRPKTVDAGKAKQKNS